MPAMDMLVAAISGAGVALALAAAAIFLTRNLILERLKNAVAHEYAVKLETHKADVAAANLRTVETLRAEAAHQQAILTATVSSLSAAHLAGHQRTLDAIATLWDETRRVADWLPSYASRSDILLDGELADDETFELLISKVDEYKEAMFLDSQRVAEKVRPFVGEYLYSHFFAYRAFTGRVPTLLLRSHRDGQPRSWHEDPNTQQLLSAVLGVDTVKALRLELPGRILRAQSAIESRMVEHIAKVLSGEVSTAVNIRKAQEIVAAASVASGR